jgi:hypothetical protein
MRASNASASTIESSSFLSFSPVPMLDAAATLVPHRLGQSRSVYLAEISGFDRLRPIRGTGRLKNG